VKVAVGTSGYNYDAWKGSFYPEKLAKSKMLAFYASQLPTVEINYTFYRMPNQKTLDGWAAQVPPDFTFALKAPQRITHQKRLVNAGDELSYFCNTAQTLGARLGPLLFQLPPNLKLDGARLHDFVESLPRGLRCAFEFRHPSWFVDATWRALAEGGCALCIADTDDLATPVERTAPWGYLRLRREDYSDAAIEKWAKTVISAGFSDEVFVYFKHEDQGLGPSFARKLAALI
jgi:uncharacterized protein YecE (DUF72 family)